MHMTVFVRSCLTACWALIAVFSFVQCSEAIHPETRQMARELDDSLSVLMRVSDDEAFFRKYIAFNVRFTLRHKLALNDTAINAELQQVIAKTALVQAAQRRVDSIQERLR
jgi:hypothetical protein